MITPKIMAHFSIVGEYFPIEEVTNTLGIIPTEKYYKGDIVEESSNPFLTSKSIKRRIETDWTLSTGYQESYDINDQLSILLNFLRDKGEVLKGFKEEYDISFLFMIIIEIESLERPAIYLPQEIINFAANIQAEIHFDLILLT